MHKALVLILAVISFAVFESCEAAPKKLPTVTTSESDDEEPTRGGRGGNEALALVEVLTEALVAVQLEPEKLIFFGGPKSQGLPSQDRST